MIAAISTETVPSSPMLSTFKRPRYYRFVKELPLTATGKLQHYLVKEMALNDLELGLLKLAIADEE